MEKRLSFLNEFQLPVRVYYEDTDAGGVVYHANYLKFMERARTEWLRQLGFEQDALIADWGIIFVVAHLELAYRKPARFNEQLTVITTIDELGKTSITFKQVIVRHTQGGEMETLTTGTVKVVCVDAEKFRPKAIPIEIKGLLQ
jgi:acyl-CoA thioester hydrolase